MIQIGGFKFKFSNGDRYNIIPLFKRYTTEEGKPDCIVDITPEDIEIEKSYYEVTNIESLFAYNAFFRKFSEWIPLNGAVLVHGVLVDVENTGVLFSAKSGTGKTTHMQLWQQLLGDDITIVNGDKPLVRFYDDGPVAYGTPWKGKENFGRNLNVPLKHICFITRSEQNSTVPLSKSEALPRIMNQVYMPKDPAAIAATLQLINRLLDSVQLWEIRCNMELDAAKTAYSALFPDNAE